MPCQIAGLWWIESIVTNPANPIHPSIVGIKFGDNLEKLIALLRWSNIICQVRWLHSYSWSMEQAKTDLISLHGNDNKFLLLICLSTKQPQPQPSSICILDFLPTQKADLMELKSATTTTYSASSNNRAID